MDDRHRVSRLAARSRRHERPRAADARTTLAGVARCVIHDRAGFAARHRRPIGVIWDEPIYSQAAENAVHWFGVLMHGGPAAAFAQTAFGVGWGLVNEHPPLVRVLNGFGWALTSGFLPCRPCIASGACCSPRSLSACWPRQRRDAPGLAAGLFAAAAVVTMPRVFFHAHVGALDFAHARDLVSGYAGVLLCSIFPPVVGAVVGRARARSGAADEDQCGPARAVLGALAVVLSPAQRSRLAGLPVQPPVALLVLIAGWPWIWRDPAAGLVNWIKFFRVHFEIRQWYAGRLYVKTPWYLAPVMVGITTPMALLAAGGHWHLQAGSEPESTTDGTGRRRRVGISDWSGLHLLGILTVVGYHMLPITAIHDQERLLLPAFLQLAVLAGEGFALIYAWLIRAVSGRLQAQEASVGKLVERRWGLASQSYFCCPVCWGSRACIRTN